MKKNKKLTLNKQTVSKLTETENVKAGMIWITWTWGPTTTDTIGGGSATNPGPLGPASRGYCTRTCVNCTNKQC